MTTFGNPADRSGGSIAAQSVNFGAKAVDYCNPEDPICHAGQGNEWKGHTDGYVPVYTSQAASFVATRLLSVLPQTGPDGGPLGLPPGPGSVPARVRCPLKARCLVRARFPALPPAARPPPWSTRPSPWRFTDHPVATLMLRRRTTVRP